MDVIYHLINDALSAMSLQERNALDCWLSLGNEPGKRILNSGPDRLQKYGFSNLKEFKTSFDSAQQTGKAFFGLMGITRISDLPFHEPGMSSEGRIIRTANRK